MASKLTTFDINSLLALSGRTTILVLPCGKVDLLDKHNTTCLSYIIAAPCCAVKYYWKMYLCLLEVAAVAQCILTYSSVTATISEERGVRMNTMFERLQAFVQDLQARFSSLPTPLNYFAGLAILVLTPFAAAGNTKWKEWVKALVCLLLLCLVLVFFVVVLALYSIWFIWKKTEWKVSLKVGVTVGIIAALAILALVFGGKPSPSNTPIPSSPSEIQVTPDVTPQIEETVPPATQPPTTQPPTTQPPVEEENDYQKLAKNEDAYLLFLRCIGTCYKDNTLSQEMFDEMAQYDGVQELVQEVLDYRYINDTLSPDFVASFADFWTDEIALDHPEVAEALQTSFELKRGPWNWIIEESAETIAADKKGDEEAEEEANTSEDFKWLSATGHLYPGVELYMLVDDEPILYGVVTALDEKESQVQIYLAAGDNTQWFERHTPWFSDVLKVRSDDKHLPQY